MADYDNKIIPILDDIIEIKVTDNDVALDDSPAGTVDSSAPAENNLDLFLDEAGRIVSDPAAPRSGAIGNIDEDNDNTEQALDFTAAEFSVLDTKISYAAEIEIDDNEDVSEITESALNDYRKDTDDSSTDLACSIYPFADEDSDLEVGLEMTDLDQFAFNKPSDDESDRLTLEAAIKSAGETAVGTQTLESIVDDVVKQLIPDLEQQLRFLVRQALEDRLSDDILQQLPADNSKS